MDDVDLITSHDGHEELALERVEVSDDSDGDYRYEAVSVSDSGSDDDEDLDAALLSLQRRGAGTGAAAGAGVDIKGVTVGGATAAAKTTLRPTVVDDYIRNFLIKAGMLKTLDVFNTEWYEMKNRGVLGEDSEEQVPDVYVRNQMLDERVRRLHVELRHAQDVAGKAQVCERRVGSRCQWGAQTHVAAPVLLHVTPCVAGVFSSRIYVTSTLYTEAASVGTLWDSGCGRCSTPPLSLTCTCRQHGTSFGRSATSIACTTNVLCRYVVCMSRFLLACVSPRRVLHNGSVKCDSSLAVAQLFSAGEEPSHR
jgi:hypothetical protein